MTAPPDARSIALYRFKPGTSREGMTATPVYAGDGRIRLQLTSTGEMVTVSESDVELQLRTPPVSAAEWKLARRMEALRAVAVDRRRDAERQQDALARLREQARRAREERAA